MSHLLHPHNDPHPANRLPAPVPQEVLAADEPGRSVCLQSEESLGDLYLERGQIDIAMAHYEKGLQLAPGATELVLKYHRAVLSLNTFARAEAILEEACRQIPCDRRLRFLLIDVQLRQEKFEAAMAGVEAAMADFGVDEGLLDAALAVRSKLGPYQRPNTPSVSLCMIVKDEAAHVSACLHSAKPVVDDIVVVDTGSQDRTADIARAFGARVLTCAWRDDFSEARNVSLAAAAGDWVLVLDADEVLSPKDYDHFRELVAQAGEPRVAYSIRTRNYTSELNTVGWQPNTGEYAEQEAGGGWFPSEKVRLFPNNAAVRFHHPVHELVEPSLKTAGVPIRKCGLQIHHHGSLKEELTRRKTRGYADIGEGKLQASADRSASLREAAIQAARLGRFAESVELWHRFLGDHPDSPEAHVNLSAACLQLGRCEEAVRYAESALRYAPAMREAHVNLALAAMHRGEVDRAVAVLDPLLRRAPDYLHARFLLAAALACRADHQKCAETLQPIGASALGPVLAVSFLELARTLFKAGQGEYCRGLVEAALHGGFGNSELATWAQQFLDGDRF